MPHFGVPELLHPLADLVDERYRFFTKQENDDELLAIAKHRMDLPRTEDARTRVDTFKDDFFAALHAIAKIHDLQTTVIWAARLRRGMRGSKVVKARFLRRRRLLGIRVIKRGSQKGRKLSNGFDLGVDEEKAFHFFKQGLRLAIRGEIRDALRLLLREQPFDEKIEAMLAAIANEEPEEESDEEQGAAAVSEASCSPCRLPAMRPRIQSVYDLAVDDLPLQLQEVVHLLTLRLKDEKLSGMQARWKAECKIAMNHLMIFHKSAQDVAGRARIENVASFLEKEDERNLVIKHFTVRGDPPHDHLFAGRPLDELAALKTRSTPDAKKMREWLLRSLAKIAALLDQDRADAWDALPAAQKELLEAEFARGPVAKPSPAARAALRDLNDLREAFERASNPKKHNKPWLSPVLEEEADRILVEDVLLRRMGFGKIAEQMDLPVDEVRIKFLELVKKIIGG